LVRIAILGVGRIRGKRPPDGGHGPVARGSRPRAPEKIEGLRTLDRGPRTVLTDQEGNHRTAVWRTPSLTIERSVHDRRDDDRCLRHAELRISGCARPHGRRDKPEPGIYLHVTAQTDFGYRIIEIWDTEEGFEEFAQRRMLPALEHLGIDRKTEITVKPLHNLFAPRLAELPGLVDGLPGAPGREAERSGHG
jgi:hypothetical protein